MYRYVTRRRLLPAVAAGLLVAIAYQAWQAAAKLHIGVAYKAKVVCSGVFVAKRAAAAVIAEAEIDDLAILRFVTTTVDPAARTVTTSALGLFQGRAAYRDGLGCTYLTEGLTLPIVTLRAGAVSMARDVFSDAAGRNAGSANDALAAVVDRAFSEPNPARPRRTQALLIVRQGRIVAERYADIGPDTPMIGWSMTKSVLNALTGILVGRGVLALDRTVPVPEWKAAGDPRSAITLDQLLRMSSGLRFDEDPGNPRSGLLHMLFETGDASGYAASQPLLAAPGSIWRYSSGTSNILSRVIRNAIGNEAEYLEFPRRALFDRLGMTTAVLETDATGTFVASSNMYATARDWARLGLLYLQDGMWDGERILPEGWVGYSRSVAPADGAKRYGAHFWARVPVEYCASDVPLPADAFHAAGHEAQLVTIVPSRDLVIVRLGRTRYPDAWDHCAFVRDVLGALEEE
jgi:CubicO group peptidase (beta-lactamase class C family)